MLTRAEEFRYCVVEVESGAIRVEAALIDSWQGCWFLAVQ